MEAEALSEYVEVMDITFVTATKDLVLSYTIREHEGDTMTPAPGSYIIKFTPKDVTLPNGETKRLTGETKVVSGAHIVEIQRKYRYEKRVRPSAADLINKDKLTLEYERAAAKVGN